MKTKNFKKEKAITLVALIITIIVLLILAMVSISLVINSGIISKSKTSVDKYSEEEIGEQLKLAYSEYQMAVYSEGATDATAFVKARLKSTFGDSLDEDSVSVANGKVTATINGQTYNYNISTGVAKKYVDPFNYGEKTRETIEIGDKVSLDTEDFMVISKPNGKLMLMPWYNISLPHNLNEELPIQTSNYQKKQFSSGMYWNEGEDKIDMNDSRNYIQTYIEAYKTTLERLGAEGVEVRVGRKSELNGISSDLLNPSQSGSFWLGSEYTRGNIWIIGNNGRFLGFSYSGERGTFQGVRPIVIIP